jgi:hypothetical protein
VCPIILSDEKGEPVASVETWVACNVYKRDADRTVTAFPLCERLAIRSAEDIAPAFATLTGATPALYVCGDALVTANRARISALAFAARLPTIYPDRAFLETGGLMAYGA